jgi:hypothetical protein
MKKYYILAIFSVALLAFASCKKDSTPVAQGMVRFVNMSPNAGALDMYLNAKISATAVAYGQAGTFASADISNNILGITANGNNTNLLGGVVFLEADKYYTVMAFDSVANMQAAFLTDNHTASTTGKTNIRFLNLVKGSSSVDIKRAGVTAALFSGRTYNDFSTASSLTNYLAVDPGPFTVSAVVAGTSVTLAQIANFEATANNNYTLVLRGFNNASGAQAVTLTAIKDN